MTVHWTEEAENYDTIERLVAETDWELEKKNNEGRGPLYLRYPDGAEISFTDSRSRTGMVRVEYTKSPDNRLPDRGESWGDPKHGIEIIEQIVNNHD
jgi:hypothetical protein